MVDFKRKTVNMFKGVAGWRGMPKGIMIHNDAGRPTGIGYESWLRSARMNNPEAGFAHDYVDSTSMLTVEDINYGAYAAANSTYNRNYHHIEICMQLSADNQRWSENTERALMRAAEVCHIAGIKPSRSTFNLHTWVSRLGTSCPARSAKQFGSYTAALQYFIDRTKYYMSKGKTIEEMMGAKTPVTNTPTKPIEVPKSDYLPGTYKFKETVKIRSNPDLSSKSDTGLTYTPGLTVNIDRIVAGKLYVWGHYISYSGKDRWVALRDNKNNQNYADLQ